MIYGSSKCSLLANNESMCINFCRSPPALYETIMQHGVNMVLIELFNLATVRARQSIVMLDLYPLEFKAITHNTSVD